MTLPQRFMRKKNASKCGQDLAGTLPQRRQRWFLETA